MKNKKKIELPQTYLKVRTKLGIQVTTTKTYWHIITTVKHPTLKGREAEVRNVLSNPDEIRVSKKDKKVILFYKKIEEIHLCVVVKFLKKRGFIVTAYWTDKIKEGELKWKK